MTMIFYDVDTQHDFMDKNGALYVPGAEEIKPNLKKLTDYAKKHKIFIFGSLDEHFGDEEHKEEEGELSKWGGPFPDHCMINTKGSERIPETSDPHKEDFTKTSYDVFTNLAAEMVLKTYEVKEAVVYGVATDYCVKAAVLGMQKRGIQCYVVEDAIAGVSPQTTADAIFDMKEAGATFVKTKDIISGKI